MRAFAGVLAILMIAAIAGQGQAQTFPRQPIVVIIGGGAGGPSDLLVRRTGPIAEKRLGQPIVFDNKAGAQNSIAAQAAAKAAPDGQTLFFGVITTFHPLFLKNNSLDALVSFSPVANFATLPTFVLTSAKAPFTTLPQMIAYAKANPGKLNHGSTAITNEIQMKFLAEKTGITFTHVPYSAVGPAVTALATGEIDVTAAAALASYAPHIKSGAVRIMMVVGPTRSPSAPDAPTAAELGIQGYAQSANMGLWGPAHLPQDVVNKLNAAFVAAVKDPEVSQFFRTVAFEPDGTTPAEQLRMTEDDIKYWKEALRVAKYEPQ